MRELESGEEVGQEGFRCLGVMYREINLFCLGREGR